MTTETQNCWDEFLTFIQNRISKAEFQNWLAPIKLAETKTSSVVLEVPNVFVQEYLLDNYQQDLCDFLPLTEKQTPSIEFIISTPSEIPTKIEPKKALIKSVPHESKVSLNSSYTFTNFIEGPSNQFVKSAALGVSKHPGKSYNPLFIYGGVGLGKTHLLHSIGHEILKHQKKLRIKCMTTEEFITDLVDHLKSKALDKMKKNYRSLDILLIDDIQFLQNRANFEEEFCNTFESLIHQNKQIVITSDKSPSQLKLSERLIARMEWGLVANIDPPDLETRVAILRHKAELKGITLPNKVAFYIAEHIFNNVRQLEGAINRLSAYCRLMHEEATEDVAKKTLDEMFEAPPKQKVTIEGILNQVSKNFDVTITDLKGSSREKKIAHPRQIAMYLAKEMLSDSLSSVANSFGGKKHSTLIHAWKKVSKQVESDEGLRKQILLTKQNIETKR